MAITFADLGLAEVDSGIVIGSVKTNSVAQRLGRKVSLPLTGTTVTKVSGIEAYGLGEGEALTASGSAVGVPMGSNVLNSTVVETNKALAYSDTLANLVFEEQPKSVSKKHDAYVFGLTPVPANYSNFTGFGEGTAVSALTIGTGDQASVDFDDALASIAEGVYNGIGLSTSMLAYLKRQRFSATGQRVFEIEGTTEGTFEGIPFFAFASSIKKAVIGNWDNFVWGTEASANGTDGTPYDLLTAGTIVDAQGASHNLTSERKSAISYDQYVGSAVVDPASFVILTPTIPAS